VLLGESSDALTMIPRCHSRERGCNPIPDAGDDATNFAME
jgi:hypothetical protein